LFGARPDAAKQGGYVALLARYVNQTTASEGGAVEGAEARSADDERKDEAPHGPEYLGAEHDGDGICVVDRLQRQDEEIGHVGQYVAHYHERHRCVYYAWEVPAGIPELANNVVGLEVG